MTSPEVGNVIYRSHFGGLWTDRLDAADELQRRVEDKRVPESEAERLSNFIEKGYAVLASAASHEAVDRFHEDISRAFLGGDERLKVRYPDIPDYVPLEAGATTVKARVVDSYAYYPSARDVLFAEPIVAFLRLIFEHDPLLFQSLSFDRGSQQGMHQDTAYVVVSEPLRLAAAWIALEDIRPGSGELMYYEGSHRLPEYRFSSEFKHWNPERDGSEQHDEWSRLINENATKLGMARKTFLPKKGDALIWAADLAHGGSPVENDELTRRSLVGHYCPVDVLPNYFMYRNDRSTKVPCRGGWYASEHYDLAASP